MKLTKKQYGIYSGKVESFLHFYELRCILQCDNKKLNVNNIKKYLTNDIECIEVKFQENSLLIGLNTLYESLRSYVLVEINFKTGRVFIKLNEHDYFIDDLKDISKIKDEKLKNKLSELIKKGEYYCEYLNPKEEFYIIYRNKAIMSLLVERFLTELELFVDKLSKIEKRCLCKECIFNDNFEKNKKCFEYFTPIVTKN